MADVEEEHEGSWRERRRCSLESDMIHTLSTPEGNGRDAKLSK